MIYLEIFGQLLIDEKGGEALRYYEQRLNREGGVEDEK